MINNPFDITKAVDYTDDEIYRYWVDIKEHGFYNLIKPETLMPMIIVGSKGSGKTHIMKYFSYELQKITKPINEGLVKDKFIGVYIRCSGFNADKYSAVFQAHLLCVWESGFGSTRSLLAPLRLEIGRYVAVSRR